MRALFDFTERQDVRNLVGRVLEYSHVQGVVVDYDPLWMQFWRLRCVAGESAVKDLEHRLFDWFHFGPRRRSFSGWELDWLIHHFDYGSELPLADIEAPDPKWHPRHWRDIQGLMGRAPRNREEPFIAKVCLLPWQREERTLEMGEYSFTVVQERRTPAYFCMPMKTHRPVVGGISIGTGPKTSGTLGGIVVDQKGGRWGVTCAHVVAPKMPIDQPAQRDGGSPGPIATGRHVAKLKASAKTVTCNPYNPKAILNVVDATLVDFTPGTSADLEVLNYGSLSGIKPKASVDPGSPVEIAGKESGARILQVGGLGVTYRLRDQSNQLYCFHHLFELRWPSFWRTVAGRPVQAGDSGAWVISSTPDGNEWAGMVVAGDRRVAYAVFAENITDWAKNDHGLSLRVT